LQLEKIRLQVQLKASHFGPVALAFARLAEGQVKILEVDDLSVEVAIGFHV
jgi:hypothetical protein